MALRIGQSRQSVRSRVTNVAAHREIFSKSCQTKPKSDCIYHFPIDLETKGHRLVPNQSKTGK